MSSANVSSLPFEYCTAVILHGHENGFARPVMLSYSYYCTPKIYRSHSIPNVGTGIKTILALTLYCSNTCRLFAIMEVDDGETEREKNEERDGAAGSGSSVKTATSTEIYRPGEAAIKPQ